MCGTLFAQNTPPRLNNVQIDTPIGEGAYMNARGRIIDPDDANRFTLTVNWGDGTAAERFSYPAGTTNFSVFHLYADNSPSNTFRIAFTIADNAGGSRNTNRIVTVTNIAPAAVDVRMTSTIELNEPATLRGTMIQEFQPPSSNSFPNSIVAGPDGALWFTETSARNIGRITTNGVFTEYPVPTGTNLQGMTVGPDGAMWFCVQDRARVGRITTNGLVTQYNLALGRHPINITTGPDGALWIAQFWGDKRLARVSTNGQLLGENVLQDGATPYGIVTGPDGNLWYTDYFYDWIVRSTTSNERTNWVLQFTASPALITVGHDDALWFAEYGSDVVQGKIGRITTNGVLTEFPQGLGTGCHGVTKGPDGNMWFTESTSNKIGRINLAGTNVKKWALPWTSQPLTIVTGSDGALWFTEGNRNRIGRLSYTTNGNVLLSGTIGDPGFGDAHTMTINWGDGTAPQVITFPPGIVSFDIPHQYTGAGPTYPVSITISDDDSTQGSTNLTVNVVRSQLTSVQRQTNGAVTLQGTGVPNATYSVEGSSDLQSWTDVGAVTADGAGAFQFQNGTAGAPNFRFFRLRRL